MAGKLVLRESIPCPVEPESNNFANTFLQAIPNGGQALFFSSDSFLCNDGLTTGFPTNTIQIDGEVFGPYDSGSWPSSVTLTGGEVFTIAGTFQNPVITGNTQGSYLVSIKREIQTECGDSDSSTQSVVLDVPLPASMRVAPKNDLDLTNIQIQTAGSMCGTSNITDDPLALYEDVIVFQDVDKNGNLVSTQPFVSISYNGSGGGSVLTFDWSVGLAASIPAVDQAAIEAIFYPLPSATGWGADKQAIDSILKGYDYLSNADYTTSTNSTGTNYLNTLYGYRQDSDVDGSLHSEGAQWLINSTVQHPSCVGVSPAVNNTIKKAIKRVKSSGSISNGHQYTDSGGDIGRLRVIPQIQTEGTQASTPSTITLRYDMAPVGSWYGFTSSPLGIVDLDTLDASPAVTYAGGTPFPTEDGKAAGWYLYSWTMDRNNGMKDTNQGYLSVPGDPVPPFIQVPLISATFHDVNITGNFCDVQLVVGTSPSSSTAVSAIQISQNFDLRDQDTGLSVLNDSATYAGVNLPSRIYSPANFDVTNKFDVEQQFQYDLPDAAGLPATSSVWEMWIVETF